MPASSPRGTDDVVHVIVSLHTHEGHDGRPVTEEELVEDEGWFASPDDAASRAARLNTRLEGLHKQDDDRRRREHASLERSYRQELKEFEILAAAGVRKRRPQPPRPYEPVPFDRFVASLPSSTSYEVRAVPRSEHDVSGLAPSGSGPVKGESKDKD